MPAAAPIVKASIVSVSVIARWYQSSPPAIIFTTRAPTSQGVEKKKRMVLTSPITG